MANNKSYSNLEDSKPLQKSTSLFAFCIVMVIVFVFTAAFFVGSSIMISLLIKSYAEPKPVVEAFNIQGHRGSRALLPENTIPAFLLALDLGINTLELDTIISNDSLVVVSHDPYLNPTICLSPSGQNISSVDEAHEKYTLYHMKYSTIELCDCGSKGNPLFPRQKPMRVHKPLLTDMLDAVAAHLKEKGESRYVTFNIEIKSTKDGDYVNHPPPLEFANLLLQVLKKKGITKRTTVQSFDVRSLQAMRQLDPSMPLSLLVQNDGAHGTPFDYKLALKNLGFFPQYLSPNYKLVTSELIQYMHERNIKVMPWTVNDEANMLKMKKLGTDGLISDDVDVAMKLRNNGQL